MRRHVAVAALGMLLTTGPDAPAGWMLQPTAVVSNTTGEQTGFEAVNLINQAGLASGYTSGVTDFDSYVASTAHPDANGGKWNSAVFVGGGTMVFDLGQVQAVSAMALWQDTARFGQHISGFSLRADADGDFSSGAIVIGSFSAPNSEPGADVFRFNAVTARYIEWSFGNSGNGFGTTAREVAFERAGAVPVPEPSALLSGLIGTGLAAGLARWRRGVAGPKRSGPGLHARGHDA